MTLVVIIFSLVSPDRVKANFIATGIDYLHNLKVECHRTNANREEIVVDFRIGESLFQDIRVSVKSDCEHGWFPPKVDCELDCLEYRQR